MVNCPKLIEKLLNEYNLLYFLQDLRFMDADDSFSVFFELIDTVGVNELISYALKFKNLQAALRYLQLEGVQLNRADQAKLFNLLAAMGKPVYKDIWMMTYINTVSHLSIL
jgi:hypothetical protein